MQTAFKRRDLCLCAVLKVREKRHSLAIECALVAVNCASAPGNLFRRLTRRVHLLRARRRSRINRISYVRLNCLDLPSVAAAGCFMGRACTLGLPGESATKGPACMPVRAERSNAHSLGRSRPPNANRPTLRERIDFLRAPCDLHPALCRESRSHASDVRHLGPPGPFICRHRTRHIGRADRRRRRTCSQQCQDRACDRFVFFRAWFTSRSVGTHDADPAAINPGSRSASRSITTRTFIGKVRILGQTALSSKPKG